MALRLCGLHTLALTVSLGLAVPALAVVVPDLDDTQLAAQVGPVAVPAATVALIHQHQRDAQPGTRLAQTLRELIDQELLSGPLRAQGLEQGIEHSSVGYSPAEVVRQITTMVLLHRDQARISADPMFRQQTERCLQQLPQLTPARYRQVLSSDTGHRLQEALTPTEQQAAAQWVLVECVLQFGPAQPPEHYRLTLADLYQDTNLQNRMLIRQGDLNALDTLRRQQLQQRLVQHWASQPQQLGATGVAALIRAIENQLLVQHWKEDQGLAEHIHGTAEGLQQLARQVTMAQIRAYYESHPEKFRRVARARMHHIQLNDEATAQQVYQQLQAGGDFAALARQHSQAPDAAQGGDLGVLEHQPDRASWLDSMAFVLPVGKVNPPVRQPQSPTQPARWEILRVDQREDEPQPVDSESVRFEASQAIARQMAVAQYQARLQQLWQQILIRVHPGQALEPAP